MISSLIGSTEIFLHWVKQKLFQPVKFDTSVYKHLVLTPCYFLEGQIESLEMIILRMFVKLTDYSQANISRQNFSIEKLVWH